MGNRFDLKVDGNGFLVTDNGWHIKNKEIADMLNSYSDECLRLKAELERLRNPEPELITFDLDRALDGDAVVTRDGRDVTQLHLFDAEKEKYQVVGVLNETIQFWNASGLFSCGTSNPEDLFMKPKKRTVWFNIYKTTRDGISPFDAYGFLSEEDADSKTKDGRIGGRSLQIEIPND